MELKIINKRDDPLLARTKIESEILFDKGTPTRNEIKSKLGKDLGKDEKLIVVKGIYTGYGVKKATNLSYVYESEEDLKRIEVVKKDKAGKKEAKPEKPEAKKEEEKPKEEQKKGEKETKQEEKPKEAKSKEQKAPEKKQ